MKTKEEIRKAAEELESRIDGKRTEAIDEPSLTELFGKALDWILQRKDEDEAITKSETQVAEETSRTEEVVKAEKEGEEEFYEGLTKSKVGEDLENVIDAAPVMEALADQIAKSLGTLEGFKKAQQQTDERLTAIEEAIVPVLKGMEAVVQIMRDVRDQPVSKTNPGYFVVPPSKDGGSGNVPEKFKEKVLKAVQQGKLDARFWSYFDTRSEEDIYASIPEGVLDE